MLSIETYKFEPAITILIVDDSALNRRLIRSGFVDCNVKLVDAINGPEGIEQVHLCKPDIILMDIMMPGMDGFEATKKIKENKEYEMIPVLFLSALDTINDKVKAFDVGGVDFVVKPFAHLELKARVKTHIDLVRANKQKNHLLKLVMEERKNMSLTKVSEGISHNFNNLISVASGNLMLLESGMCDLPEIAKDSIKDIKISLERMQTLTKQFLHIAGRSQELKSGNVSLIDVNLNKIIDLVINNIVLGKKYTNIKCVNELKENSSIIFDNEQIQEVFYLIINEALDATVGKANIKINGKLTDNKFLCIILIDNIKMPNNYQEVIFDPFSLPLANVGAGLSFSVAKKLMKLNNSSISANVIAKNSLVFQLLFNLSNKNEVENA